MSPQATPRVSTRRCVVIKLVENQSNDKALVVSWVCSQRNADLIGNDVFKLLGLAFELPSKEVIWEGRLTEEES